MSEPKETAGEYKKRKPHRLSLLSAPIGLVVGVLLTGAAAVWAMPKMMI